MIATFDGCDWEPARNRPALRSDVHHRTTRATVLVGHDGAWRLCDQCSGLQRFARYRKRRPIPAPPEPARVLDELSGLELPEHVAACIDDLRHRRLAPMRENPAGADELIAFLLREFGQAPDDAAPMGPAAAGAPGPDQST